MKYIKVFENLKEEDWLYFFQEIIDDYDVNITAQFGVYQAMFFKFTLHGNILFESAIDDFFYDSKKPKKKNSNLSELGILEKPIRQLISRVDYLNGDIIISKRDAYESIDQMHIYITKNTFKGLK